MIDRTAYVQQLHSMFGDDWPAYSRERDRLTRRLRVTRAARVDAERRLATPPRPIGLGYRIFFDELDRWQSMVALYRRDEGELVEQIQVLTELLGLAGGPKSFIYHNDRSPEDTGYQLSDFLNESTDQVR